jgi:hypothetical protein
MENTNIDWVKLAKEKRGWWKTESVFELAPDYIKQDYYLNMLALTEGNEKFYNIDASLQNNRNFIMELITKEKANSHYLHYSEDMRSDKEIIDLSYNNSHTMIYHIPKKLRTKELMMELLSRNGLGLEHVRVEERENLDLCRVAVKQNGNAIQWCTKMQSIQLCKDSEIVYKIIETAPEQFKNLSKRIKNNIDFAFAAIKKFPSNVQFATDKIKDNKEWALELINNHGCDLYYFSGKLQYDHDLILAQVKTKAYLFQYAPVICRENLELICQAVAINYSVYATLEERFKNNPQVIVELLKHDENVLIYLPKEVKEEIGDFDPMQYMTQKALSEKLHNNLDDNKMKSKKIKL